MKLLSPSERTIVSLVGQGKSNKEIGEQLFVSTRTVEKHRSNIIAKLNLCSKKESLTIWAKENLEIFI
jgi:DNA-binding NarL/FixJ family response regulator